MARGLFVEPFYGGSHRAFLDGLVANTKHELTLLTLPGGEWRQRMRRGAQELARDFEQLRGDFDFLVASSMLDLPAFLALTRGRLGNVPVMAYFHENQFTYPRLRGTKFNSWFGQINYLSAVVADVVAFNSEFHREDFLAALRTLDSQPNNWLLSAAIDKIEAKSCVLPVGIDLEELDAGLPRASDVDESPLVLWNHRWEFDKAPEVFARAMVRLAGEGLPFRVAVAGERGLTPVPAMLELPALLGERLVQFGRVESREAYRALLSRSDIVVSTTRHEFFGIGMVEAMYRGCFPVAPRRYNYPALVPHGLHDACLWQTEDDFVAKLRAAIHGPRPGLEELRASAARFGWRPVAAAWDESVGELATRNPLTTESVREIP